MPASLLASVTGTTPVELYKVKPLTRIVIKRVMVANNDGTNTHRVQIGYSDVNPDGTVNTATFTQVLPDIYVSPNTTVVIEVPPATVSSTRTSLRALTVRLAAAASAGTDVKVMVEFEEA